jgi:hypothetical protein
MRLVGFRLSSYETPLWAEDNFSAGRFNRPGSRPTQYLSLHPMCPWAEMLRGEDRRTRDLAITMRYPLWAIRLELDERPLEVTFDTAAEHGITPAELVGDDYAPCQALADRLHAAGCTVFTAPSAALPGTANLVVLEPRVVTAWEFVPADELELPTAMAAQDGRCPEGLWDHVRHRGVRGRHPALAAWERDEPFHFVEPDV